MIDSTVTPATNEGSSFEISIADDGIASEATKTPKVEQVLLASITRDPELNARASGVNKGVVKEYATALASGAAFPPVVVFKDVKGKLWLADGFHRCAAAELAERTEILAEIREGDRKDALVFAASANGSHGLRRTNRDKRHAAKLLLAAFPRWSDRKIAAAAGIDHKTIGRARAEVAGGEKPQAGRTGFNAAKGAAKIERAIGKLIKAWPKRDPEGRARFAQALQDAAVRLRGATTVELAPAAGSKPAKAKRGATKGKVAA